MARLPFHIGFALIGLVVLLFFIKAAYKVSEVKETMLSER